MNKRQKNLLIIISIAFVVVVGAIITISYVTSFHKVTLTNADSLEFTMTQKNNDTDKESLVTTITASTTIQLKDGTYCLVPKDTQYEQDPDCFVVGGKDVVKTLHPSYSEDKLSSLLDSEEEVLQNTITNKYSPLITSYVLKRGQLFDRGEWYGATLTTNVAANDQGDVYRVVLHKEKSNWVIVAYPQLVLNKNAYPNIPSDILDNINKMVGNY